MRFLLEPTTGASAPLSADTRWRHGFAWLSSVLELGDYGARHNKPMEGLRGLAILLVFAVHYFTLAGAQVPGESISAQLAASLSSVGNIGVDLFFILSGFLIYGSLIRRRTPFPDYLRRRVQRIYPAFLVVFALYLALSALVPSENKIPDAPGHALAYIGANLLLLPGIFSIRPMITVAWSLSYEFCFYLLTPVAIGVLSLRAWQPASRTALLALSSVFLLALSAAGLFPHVRMLGFFAGMMLWEALEPLALGRSPSSRWADRTALPLLTILMLAFTYLQWAPLRALAVTLSFSVLCWACLSGDGLCARLFRRTPIRWLGNLSYSYYLMHGLALKALFFALARYGVLQAIGGPSVWLLCPLAFFWTLALTFPVFLFVERPLSLVRGPAPAAAPHAAAASVRPSA